MTISREVIAQVFNNLNETINTFMQLNGSEVEKNEALCAAFTSLFIARLTLADYLAKQAIEAHTATNNSKATH